MIIIESIFRKIVSFSVLIVFIKAFESTLTSEGVWFDGENGSLVLMPVEHSLITEQDFYEF